MGLGVSACSSWLLELPWRRNQRRDKIVGDHCDKLLAVLVEVCSFPSKWAAEALSVSLRRFVEALGKAAAIVLTRRLLAESRGGNLRSV